MRTPGRTFATGACCGLALLVSCADPELRPVPEPVALASMDPVVRGQYRDLRAEVDRLLDASRNAESDRESEQQASAEAMGRLGMWFQAYSLPGSALIAYGNARRLDPENPRWAYYAGMLRRARGELGLAAETFTTALERALGADEAAAAAARLAEVEFEIGGTLEPAAARLEPLLGTPQESARVVVLLARIRRAQTRPEEAVELARRALTLQPGATRTLYLLGQALRDTGKLAEAEFYLAHQREDDPEPLRMADPWAREMAAMDIGVMGRIRDARAFAAAGRRRPALARFRSALEVDPENVEARFGAARMLLELDRLDEAEPLVAEVLRKAPEVAMHHSLAGRLAALRGDAGVAERNYRRAVDLDPDLLPAWLHLSALLRNRGDPAAAGVALEAALRLAPGDSDVICALAEVWIETGRRQDAVALLRDTLSSADEPWAQKLLLRRLEGTADGADGSEQLQPP